MHLSVFRLSTQTIATCINSDLIRSMGLRDNGFQDQRGAASPNARRDSATRARLVATTRYSQPHANHLNSHSVPPPPTASRLTLARHMLAKFQLSTRDDSATCRIPLACLSRMLHACLCYMLPQPHATCLSQPAATCQPQLHAPCLPLLQSADFAARHSPVSVIRYLPPPTTCQLPACAACHLPVSAMILASPSRMLPAGLSYMPLACHSCMPLAKTDGNKPWAKQPHVSPPTCSSTHK